MNNLQSFDIVFFQGGDYVSDFIRFVEGRKLKPKGKFTVPTDAFSHVGMIVKSDVLDHPLVLPNRTYIFESTMSGPLNDGVLNIEGNSYLGVQLRDFQEIVQKYADIPNTKIAVAHLSEKYRDIVTEVSKDSGKSILDAFTQIFNELNGTIYDLNPVSLLGSTFRICRLCRSHSEKFWKTENFLFCSELVATIYKYLGIFPDTVNPKNVIPMDFLGYDTDTIECGGIPLVLEDILYMKE